MKKLVNIVSVIIFVSTMTVQVTNAQTSNNKHTAPEAVQKTFAQKFPTVTKIKWGKESSKVWEAEFKINLIPVSANFSGEGVWLETETEITVSQLPEAVSSSISKQYPKYKITGADKIESSDKGIMYEADIKSDSKKKEIMLSEDGSLIK